MIAQQDNVKRLQAGFARMPGVMTLLCLAFVAWFLFDNVFLSTLGPLLLIGAASGLLVAGKDIKTHHDRDGASERNSFSLRSAFVAITLAAIAFALFRVAGRVGAGQPYSESLVAARGTVYLLSLLAFRST